MQKSWRKHLRRFPEYRILLFCFRSHGDSEVSKNCQTLVSHEIKDTKEANIEMRMNGNPDNKTQLAELASSDVVTVSYEFLVKWVGEISYSQQLDF